MNLANPALALKPKSRVVLGKATVWGVFLAVLFAAALLRLVFYTGFFGSDEVIYTQSAFKLLDGDWSVSRYVGANRYGMNLPVAGFAYLFGRSEFVANLYPFILSLGEVALVFYLGLRMFGLRAAVLSALVLAFLPLHAYYAGRLNPDAPLAFMITASFLFFWLGENRGRVAYFIFAGVAAGFVFWIKPPASIYLGVFLLYPLLFWRWNWRWAWMLASFLVLVISNHVFFYYLTGEFFFLYDATQERLASQPREILVLQDPFRYSSYYYFVYLFFKIYHTWLLGFLAIAAILIYFFRRRRVNEGAGSHLRYLVWWGAGSIAIFSLFPASLDPFVLIPKQTNYMLMFVAPLTVLAGYTLAKFRGMTALVTIVAVLVPSFLLVAMQQNKTHMFTANSKAFISYVARAPEARFYGGTNAIMAAKFQNLLHRSDAVPEVHSLTVLLDPSHPDFHGKPFSVPRFALIDMETISWGQTTGIEQFSDVPSCWLKDTVIEPEGFGMGWRMLRGLRGVVAGFPDPVGSRGAVELDRVTVPRRAVMYRIPEAGCALDEENLLSSRCLSEQCHENA